jgi:ATP adenylyltransferase
MKHVKAIIVILFLLLVVIIAVQNYHALSSHIEFGVNLGFFKAGSFQAPAVPSDVKTPGISVFLIGIITFLVGVVCALLYGITERFSFKRQVKILMKDVKDQEKELNSLRNLPVTTEDMSADQPPVNT